MIQTRQRTTKQFSAILAVLQAAQGPMPVPDLVAAAKKKAPLLNKTTVYRTLEKLVSDGLVEAVLLREGVLHYELKEPAVHHHHFVCGRCKKIFCVDGCVRDIDLLLPKGFVLESHEVTLRGICKGCNARS